MKKSYVDKGFWKWSLVGNILLSAHYFIQFQYVFLLVQIGNGMIAWRNLNLMSEKQKPFSFQTVLLFFASSMLLISALFFLQVYFFYEKAPLISLFFGFLQHKHSVSFFWYLIGTCGGLLFSSRFWIQWWNAEKKGRSELNQMFWLLSVIGSMMALAYFLRTQDQINIINYAFGLIPYVRNLMLLKENKLEITLKN